MADPFAVPVSGAAPQEGSGFGGISPDAWRNLAMFGAQLATSANARNGQGFLTYGNGIAGPLGAAVQGTMQGAQEQAKLRSGLQLQQQQIETSKLGNQLTRLQIPFMQEKLTAAHDYFNPPSGIAGAGPGSVSQGTSGDYADMVIGHEGGGQNQASSANGVGQFTNDTWMRFAQANPQYFPQGADAAQVLAARTDPAIGRAAVNWLGDQNAPVLAAGGVQPTAGAKGLAHFLGPQVAASVWKADPDASAAAIIKASLPAEQAQAYLTANPQLQRQTAGQVTAPYRAWDGQGGGATAAAPTAPPAAQLGQPDPVMLAQAQAKFRKAQQGAALGLNTTALAEEAKTMFDLAYAGPKAGTEAQAKAPYTFNEVRPGGVLTQGGKPTFGAPLISEEVVPSGPNAGAHFKVFRSPLTGQVVGGTDQPAGATGGTPSGVPGGIQTQLAPLQETFQHKRGDDLAEAFHKVDTDAASARDSNYLFDNLRNDSKTWSMGKFADIEGEARAWLSAAAGAFNVAAPELNQKLADYQAFNKSSGMLLRTAVHDTSSRAAVQEYSMIGKTLPQPTTSEQGFSQVADQWQGLNDFRLAQQQFARQYQGNPQDMQAEFNARVSPTSFMLHRMAQTPQGQYDMQAMVARMQETPEGKLLMRRMMQKYNYARESGLFSAIDQTNPQGQ